jgi:predicted nucleic acid-binding protein
LIALDTNVLLYAVDTTAGAKHASANALLKGTIARKGLFLPLQVLVEFHNGLVRKFRHRRGRPCFSRSWCAVRRDRGLRRWPTLAGRHAELQEGTKIPLWDALIWAVRERAGVRTLVTKDFQDGRPWAAVTFVDPFNPANAEHLRLASA